MQRNLSLSIIIFLVSFSLLGSSFSYAQAPEEIINDPFPTHQDGGSACEPVRPDNLEGISGDELIQRWLNYADCMGIDINEVPESNYTANYKAWFMSSHEITLSQGLDSDLAEYMQNVPQDHLAPVVLLASRSMSIAEHVELIGLGLRYYRGSMLTNGGYITFIPVSSIHEIANKDYIAGVTLFKPCFKYHKVPAIEEKLETQVYSIEETKPYHYSDLQSIGIEVQGYDDTVKSYAVKMSSSQYAEVANLQWTKFIVVFPASVPESLMTVATNKADNYDLNLAVSNYPIIFVIYALLGIGLAILSALLISKFRKAHAKTTRDSENSPLKSRQS